MEYRMQGQMDWTPVGEGQEAITNLVVGIYEVRYAAKEGYKPSPAVEVEVPGYVAPEKTQAPVITTKSQTVYTDAIIIVGTAENFADITITGGASTVTGVADEDGDFSIEVTLIKDAENTLRVAAKVDGKTESEAPTVVITHITPVEASIQSVEATNGTLTIILKEKPTVAPVADDFSATVKIDDKELTELGLSNFNYDDNITVTFAFKAIEQTAVDQTVVVVVSLNEGDPVSAPAFTVEADPDKAAEKAADEFRADHSEVLALTENTVGIANKDDVNTALEAYGRLSEPAKTRLADEKQLLDSLLEKIKELEVEQAINEEILSFQEAHKEVLELEVEAVSTSDKGIVEAALDAFNSLSQIAQSKLADEKKLLDNLLVKISELEQEDEKAAEQVEDLIAALPPVDELTLVDKETVEEARTAYNALTDEQKALITNLDVLVAAQEKIVELEADKAAAEKVEGKIAALRSVEELTLEDAAAVAEVRDAFNALTEAQQILVLNVTVLEAAEAKIAELQTQAEKLAEAIKTAEEAIANLPDEITLDDKETVENARQLVESVFELDENAQIEGLDRLKAAEAQISKLEDDKEAADAVIAKINALPEVAKLTLDHKEAVEAARSAYEELSDDQKVLVINIERLKKSEARISKLAEDKKAADAVTDQIAALPEVTELTLEHKEAVEAARAAYDVLTKEQKELVDNLAALETIEERMAELEVTVDQIGDEIVNGLYVVNRDYTNNNITSDDIGPIILKIGGKDVTDAFDFTFYDSQGGNKITKFDLSDGATTFKVFMEANCREGKGYNDVSADVVFKYRSVTIGKESEDYYTIEDALGKAKARDIIVVKYNTSFANVDVAQSIYTNDNYIVKSGVTLLLPYNEEFSTDIDNAINSTTAINRNQAYVLLTLPAELELMVNGTLTVNALRGNASTTYMGFVHSSNYAKLQLDGGNSKIIVGEGGTLNAIGFVCGDGFIEAKTGSNIVESFFVKQFRGGTDTANTVGEAFPFDQFTAANIEVDLILEHGSIYSGSIVIYMNSSWWPSRIGVAGTTTSLIQIESGIAKKSYNIENGHITIKVDGEASVNNTSVSVGSTGVNTGGMTIPFDGSWHFVVTPTGRLIINAEIALLPGATMTIQEGGEVIVVDEASLTVFDPFEYVVEESGYSAYPMPAEKYYRFAPAFGFTPTTPARLDIAGSLTIHSGGGIAGRVDNAAINKEEGVVEDYDFKYFTGSSKALVQTRRVHLLSSDADNEIILVSNWYSGKEGMKMMLRAIVRDGQGKPLSGVEVEFGGGKAENYSVVTGKTNEKGIATTIYDATDGGTGTLTATIGDSTIKAELKFDYSGAAGCPLIYSFDGQDFYLEHEPVSYSINQAFEGTTYGTLRKLQPYGGRHLIRVAENDMYETFVNEVNLYAVDYATGSGIQEVFVDIFGDVHTIHKRENPISFIDSSGQDWLNEVTTPGKLVWAPMSMLNQGRYVESYVATFERSEDISDLGKLMVSAKITNAVESLTNWFHAKIDGPNNTWWIEKAMQANSDIYTFIDALSMVNMKIDLWNGSEWVYQGEFSGGSHFFEDFLIPVDLSIIDKSEEEVKVRLRVGSGFFEIDQVSMDFSSNMPVNMQKLELDTAFHNGITEVSSIVGTPVNNGRVKVQSGEYIDLYYLSPELQEGFERGFMVDFTGYHHWSLESIENPMADTLDGLTYEEIIALVLTVQPEAEETIAVLEWFFDLTNATYGQSMDYKVEQIFVEHVLPWLDGNLQHTA